MSTSYPNPPNPYSSPGDVRNKGPIAGESNSLQGLSEHIRKTVFWARIVAIIGFVFGGISLLGGIFGVVMMGLVTGAGAGQGGMPALFMGLMYFFGALVYIVPSALLFGFTNKLGEFLNSPNMGSLSVAMQAQAALWRILGIMVLALIGLFFLMVAGGVVFAILAASVV